MKKFFNYAVMLSAILAMSITFNACGDDSDGSTPSSTTSIVGNWKYDFKGGGFSLYIFNKDNTYRYLEYEGGWDQDEKGTYYYDETNNLLYLKEDGKTKGESFKVISLDAKKLVMDWDDGICTFYSYSGSVPDYPAVTSKSIIGAWKITFEEGDYNIIIFENDGVYRDIAYNTSGECMEDQKGEYIYNSSESTLTIKIDYKERTMEVLTLDPEKTLVCKYGDEVSTLLWYTGYIPEYPAVKETNSRSLIGTWDFIVKDKNYGITFFENGTFAYYDIPGNNYNYSGYYQFTTNILLFIYENYEGEHRIPVEILTFSDNQLEFEGKDTYAYLFDGIFRGTRESNVDATTTAQYKKDIVGKWQFGIKEKVNGPILYTVTLNINNDGTFKCTSDYGNTYNGIYDICDNKVLFYEETSKCPIGGIYTIKEITNNHIVILNIYNREFEGTSSSNTEW